MDDRSHMQQAAEPVRSRWSPKPDQILILESIFNNGMVNPPKDETVRIRKLLQRYGPVGDANVFYWFQNRRSRSRRKQRQIQAALGGGEQQPAQPHGGGGGAGIPYENFLGDAFVPNSMSFYPTCNTNTASSSSFGPDGNDDGNSSNAILSFPGLVQEYEQNPIFCSPPTNFPYQSPGAGGGMTVFINGVATEVGGVDIKGMFGGDFMLLHSSGIPVQVLQHGESYFLVPRQS